MIRGATALWLGVATAIVLGLFHVKDAVRDLEREIAQVDRELGETREAVRVLKAEWAFLNRPDRLAELSARYLGMTPAGSEDIRQPAELPLRMEPGLDVEGPAGGQLIAASSGTRNTP